MRAFGGSLAFIATALNATALNATEERLKKSFEDLAKLNRYETVIYIVAHAVHKTIDPNTVMENAVEAISRNMDTVNNICIYLREGGEAVMHAHRGYPEWFVERVKTIPFSKEFTWKTMSDGKMIYVADTEKDTVIGPAGRELGTKSYLSIPINSHQETVGVININSEVKYAFGADELRVFEIVSRQIELAIINARHMQDLIISEERYHTLTELAPIGIFRSDTRGMVVYVNSKLCEITGLTKEEAYAEDWMEKYHPDDREYVASRWQEAMTSRQEFREEYRFVDRKGNTSRSR